VELELDQWARDLGQAEAQGTARVLPDLDLRISQESAWVEVFAQVEEAAVETETAFMLPGYPDGRRHNR
jgi:hypothetical protein